MKKIIIILLAILPSTYPKPPSDSLFYKATRINLILDEDVRNIRKNYLFNEVPNSKDKRLKCNLRIDSLNWEILIGIENNIIKSIRSESQGNQLNIQNYLLLLVSNVENITKQDIIESNKLKLINREVNEWEDNNSYFSVHSTDTSIFVTFIRKDSKEFKTIKKLQETRIQYKK